MKAGESRSGELSFRNNRSGVSVYTERSYDEDAVGDDYELNGSVVDDEVSLGSGDAEKSGSRVE